MPRIVRNTIWLVAALVGFGSFAARSLAAQEWYDFYADGQAALKNGQPARAVDLLRQAIQRRPAPGRSVPTYGTNFEPRYFPYLRLAEAYLGLEAWDDALKTLETSARFNVEPASDRASLEARARAGLKAIEPAPAPAPAAAPPPPPPPSSVAVPESTARVIPPPKESVTTRTDTVRIAVPPERTSARPTEPAPRGTPVLEITSDPPGAQVFVDDAPVGRTDPETGRLRLTTLEPGRHRVRFSASGRDDLVSEVVLGRDVVPLRGELPPSGATTAPAEEPSNGRGREWALAGLALAAVAGALWRWRVRSTSKRPDPVRVVRRTPPDVDAGASLETFPIEFGDYQLTRRIGKGGMAVVYEAERRGERFALKRPISAYLDDPLFLERFVREADLGRALHHPNIIRIFDRGQVGDTPYFAMELIDGETLRDRLDRDGPLDPIVATAITARVAEALDYAHLKGVVHRDLKPSYIMLERSGGVKVMDYGIARAQHREGLTATGGFVGTPDYAAPEAAESLSEPRSDLYSLGVVFFEMLTGTLPFPGDHPLAVIRGHAFVAPPVPSKVRAGVPATLDRIVLRLLAKQPADRPAAEALLNELADFLEASR
jgi:tRNA A-37 threonylcarbamoyl transferase component Bud32